MEKIKFGTDGWRAIIAKEFTTINVCRVTEGVCEWLIKNFENPKIIIGHDCRFGGEMFLQFAAEIFIKNGVKVFAAKNFVSTPMVSMGVLNYKADLGIVITASHNPADYNGYKLKGKEGGPLNETKIKEIEVLIPDTVSDYSTILVHQHTINWVDLESDYIEKIKKHFDIEKIKNSRFNFAYDAMYGAGQNVMKKIMPHLNLLHCEYRQDFNGISPEPILKNLSELSAFVKHEKNIDCSLVTDGDADRIGLFNKNGDFIDSHHIILLLIHYLKKYKKMDGSVVTAFSSSVKINKLCEHYGLNLDIVKIGFKYTSELMLVKDILVGGEESGGIAVKGHIPERDGLWMGMLIWEFMTVTNKSLEALIEEIYAITGKFVFKRIDLKITEQKKLEIIENCNSGKYKYFGNFKVQKTETLDGYKYILSDHEWVMIRPSGTEPVLRTYSESHDEKTVDEILKACHKTILV
jgi:phosphomannomutase